MRSAATSVKRPDVFVGTAQSPFWRPILKLSSITQAYESCGGCFRHTSGWKDGEGWESVYPLPTWRDLPLRFRASSGLLPASTRGLADAQASELWPTMSY